MSETALNGVKNDENRFSPVFEFVDKVLPKAIEREEGSESNYTGGVLRPRLSPGPTLGAGRPQRSRWSLPLRIAEI